MKPRSDSRTQLVPGCNLSMPSTTTVAPDASPVAIDGRVALSEPDFDIAGFDATVRLDDVNVS